MTKLTIAAMIAKELYDARQAGRRAQWAESRYARTINRIAAMRCVERARELREHAKDYDFWVSRYCQARTDKERTEMLMIVSEIEMAA